MANRRQIWQPLTKPRVTAHPFEGELATLRKYWRRVRQTCESDPEFVRHADRLRRRVVIETGQIEGVYSLDRGTTETLITHGYEASLIGHGNAGPVSAEHAIDILRDQERAYAEGLAAVVGGMDVVGGTRTFDEPIVRELHAVLTRSQEHAEGRDSLGNRVRIPLRRGEYKHHANNPTRADGTVEEYCPPEHVGPQMAELFRIYRELEIDGVDPVFLAAWFHHAFTSIHPFQDGNGRLARLLASIILVKHGMLYLHVERGEERAQYLDALRDADLGVLDRFVKFVARGQKAALLQAVQFGSSRESVPDSGQSRLDRAIAKFRHRFEGDAGSWHDRVRSAFSPVVAEIRELLDRLQKQIDPGHKEIGFHLADNALSLSQVEKTLAAAGLPFVAHADSIPVGFQLVMSSPLGQRRAGFLVAEPGCAARGLLYGFAWSISSLTINQSSPGRMPLVGDLDATDTWSPSAWTEIASEVVAELLESLDAPS